MSMKIADFTGELVLNSMIHRNYPNRVTELNNIATALSSDVTTHDKTIEAAPAGLVAGSPLNSRFTNDVLLTVNKGKAGNLTATAMSNAITAGLSLFNPPVNTAAPAVTGTATVGSTLTCTNGTWSYVPTTYTYQWLRGGAQIAGATFSTYVLVAADSGRSVLCQVTATNTAGSTPVNSNAVTIA
jgi:hypothetical protein